MSVTNDESSWDLQVASIDEQHSRLRRGSLTFDFQYYRYTSQEKSHYSLLWVRIPGRRSFRTVLNSTLSSDLIGTYLIIRL